MEDVTKSTFMTWEELEDCGDLDRRLQKMSPEPSRCHSQSCQSIGVSMTSGQSRQKDRSAPATPQVRILKRQPNSDPCLAATNARANAAKPIRTLEEREAAYAEARLRILGSAAAECSSPANSAPTAPVNHLKKTTTPKPQQFANTESQVCLVNGSGVKRLAAV